MKSRPGRLHSTAYRQGHAFFVTVATRRRYPWFQIHRHLSDSAIDVLKEMQGERNTLIYAWCFMPDHVHLLLRDKDLIDFMRRFKGRMVPLARSTDPQRRLWQRSFHDHGLRREESLEGVARYIWDNPLRKGLTADPAAYPGSGSLVWPEWKRLYGAE
jgi:REP element-mobilizing transposase RayT